MKFSEFFNEYDVTHLAAYQHLNDHGQWPEGFVPKSESLEFDKGWHQIITGRMAIAYVRLGVTGQVFGMPSIDQ